MTINNPNLFPFWLIFMQTHPHHKRAVSGSLSLFINSDWLQKVLPKPSVMPSDSLLIFARCCRSSVTTACHYSWHSLAPHWWVPLPAGAGSTFPTGNSFFLLCIPGSRASLIVMAWGQQLGCLLCHARWALMCLTCVLHSVWGPKGWI